MARWSEPGGQVKPGEARWSEWVFCRWCSQAAPVASSTLAILLASSSGSQGLLPLFHPPSFLLLDRKMQNAIFLLFLKFSGTAYVLCAEAD